MIKNWAEDLNRLFKDNTQMCQQVQEKMLKILIFREMQIKTMRCHLTPVRMAIIRMTRNKCWPGCGKREPSYTVGGNINWYSQYGKQVLEKLKIELPYDSAIPLLGIYPVKMKTLTQKDIRAQYSLQHYLQ